MTNTRPDNSTRRVIIAGAGIAGLATALRLHRSGWHPLVVERAPARRSSGYMVNLLGAGYEAAEQLGIAEALRRHDLGPFTSILVNADGTRKLTVPTELAHAALGERALTVFRGDLESTLFEAVRDDVEVRFATTVTGVTQDDDRVRVTFSDGSHEEADLLVGADGLHSGVRELVFGPEAEYLVDLGCVVAAFPLTHVPEDLPDGAGTTFIGPGRTAAVINLGPGRSCAFFTYRTADAAAHLAWGPHRALAEAFGDLGGSIPAVLPQLSAAEVYFDSVSQIKAPAWHSGRVTLLGDSAWCVSLFAGHGAALALTGATTLGDALDSHPGDLSSAMSEWESRRRPEARTRQAQARKGMVQYTPPTRAHVWAQHAAIRAMTLPGLRQLTRRSIARAARS